MRTLRVSLLGAVILALLGLPVVGPAMATDGQCKPEQSVTELEADEAAFLPMAMDPLSPVLGEDSGPYVGDVEGDDIVLVNPTMVFYGVDINSRFETSPGIKDAGLCEKFMHGIRDAIK